jgi:hypothetical protein
VLHHILRNPWKVVDEAYSVLGWGGTLIIAEGVPPSKRCLQEFIDIFALKEDRVVFMPEDLVDFLSLVSAQDEEEIMVQRFVLPQMSISNWLANASLPQKVQEKIMEMHRNASPGFKEDYNMIETADDCLCDFHVVITSVVKGM